MANWTVTLTRVIGGRPDTITRDNIVAATQQEAIQKAQMGIPNSQTYSQVTATQLNPTGEPMVNNQQGQSNQQQQGAMPSQPYTGQFHECTYPYKLMLPSTYASVVETSRHINEAKIPSIKVLRQHGKIYIEIPCARDLQLFVNKLLENNDLASKSIVDGIIRSMR
jgi:hypothetical protein